MKFKVGDRVRSLIKVAPPILYNAEGVIAGQHKGVYAVKFDEDTESDPYLAMWEDELELVK